MRIVVFWVLLSISGCASLGPPQVEQQRSVVSTKVAEKREPQPLNPLDVGWSGGRLRADFTRDIHCSQETTETVHIRDVQVRPAHDVGVSFLGSAVLVVLGGAATVLGASAVDETPTTDEFEPADAVILGGTASLLLGAYGIYDTYRILGASRPVPQGAVSTQLKTNVGKATKCGVEPVPVEVEFEYDGTGYLARSFPSGTVDIDFLADAQLCPEHLLTEPLLMNWSALQGEFRGELWRGSMSDCARVHAARRLLSKANEEFEDASKVPEATEAYARAQDLVRKLAADHPARAMLLEEVGRVEERLLVGAAHALGESVRRLRDAAGVGTFDEVFEEGQRALAASTLVQTERVETALIVSAAYAESITTPGELLTIASANEELFSCLRADVCSGGFEPPLLRDAYRPVVDHATRIVEQAASQILREAKRGPIADAEAALTGESVAKRWCETVDWPSSLETACARLASSRLQAWALVGARRQELVAASIARTEKEWRAQFKTCRKVHRGLEAFQSLTRCEGECRAAAAKLNADLRKLQNFSATEPMWSQQSLTSVREACAAAGCPRCP